MAEPCTHFHPPSISIHFPPTSARIHLPSTYFHSPSIHIPYLSVTSTHLQQPPLIFHPPSTYFHQPSTLLHLPPLISTHLKSAKIWPILEKFVFNKKACNFVQTVAAEEYASTIGQQKCFRRSIMVRFSRT